MLSTAEIYDLVKRTYADKWVHSSASARYKLAVESHLATLPSYSSVEGWLQASKHLSLASQGFCISAIRVALKRYGHAEQATQLPTVEVPKPKQYDHKALQELPMQDLDPHLSACLEFLQAFGCRVSEAFQAFIKDTTLIIPCSKNKSEVVWPLASLPESHQIIATNWVDMRDTGRKGKPYTMNQYAWDLRKLKESGVIPAQVSAHAFRSAFITDLCQRVQIADVARAVGHKNINTTMRYNQPDPAELASRIF